MDLTQLSSQQDPDSPCTTDYVAFLDFNETKATQPLATERAATQQTYIVPSLTDDWQAGIQCARAVEGRPFVDADGNRLQASMCMESDALTAWSAEKSALEGTISPDEALGQEWADRALGEHASIPAFAAFTIALMSNNAPPILVQDSLSAAMDEVRHAQTSFEAASLLLGTTVEPGPVPPSVHSFEPDMTQLAMAAAQEGCIDETLSALVAAYEVDTRLDEITSIDQATISVLKDKMRIIALEETRHSALAFSTVRWACEVDSAACSAVRGGPFQEENLIQAFEKRFGHFNVNAGAMNAYARVHHILVPFVVENKRHEEFIDCNQSMARTLDEGSTLMEQMADHIIHNTICGSMA